MPVAKRSKTKTAELVGVTPSPQPFARKRVKDRSVSRFLFPITTLTETMAALAQTCKIALPARVAARAGKTARRTGIVAKAAAPVDAVRVQQKVRVGCKNCAIHISSREARNREAWHRGVRGVASKAHPVCGVCDA